MRIKQIIILFHIIAALFFSSCRSYHVSLTYSPPIQRVQQAPETTRLKVGRVNDIRDVQGTEIGTIRNEFGVPIKTLHAKRPVAQIAHNALIYALKLRSASTADHPNYVISADIIELWCHQYTTQEAGCRARIKLYNAETRTLRFSKEYAAKRTRQTLKVSYWSNVEELAAVVSEVLQAVVDDALDDPDFSRAIR